jgi:hypothetical protein
MVLASVTGRLSFLSIPTQGSQAQRSGWSERNGTGQDGADGRVLVNTATGVRVLQMAENSQPAERPAASRERLRSRHRNIR